MCTDSEIAKDFQLSRRKLTYITNFGIAPYFHQLLIDELKNCNYYSLSLDESLNDFTQTCQIGHDTVNVLLASFNEIINTIDSGNKMIQNSMDGPSSRWKLFGLIQKNREEKEQKKLLDVVYWIV